MRACRFSLGQRLLPIRNSVSRQLYAAGGSGIAVRFLRARRAWTFGEDIVILQRRCAELHESVPLLVLQRLVVLRLGAAAPGRSVLLHVGLCRWRAPASGTVALPIATAGKGERNARRDAPRMSPGGAVLCVAEQAVSRAVRGVRCNLFPSERESASRGANARGPREALQRPCGGRSLCLMASRTASSSAKCDGKRNACPRPKRFS